MKKPGSAIVPLSTQVPSDLLAMLRSYATERGLKIGYVVTQAVREYLARTA